MTTRKQHYIPQFILRSFLVGTSLKLVSIRTGNRYYRGASNSMFSDWFYEHRSLPVNHIENTLASRETHYAEVINHLVSNHTMSMEEYRILIEFRHVHYYRSREFYAFFTFQMNRGANSWRQRADWRMINGVYTIQSDEDVKLTQLRAIQSVIEHRDEAYQLNIMIPICFLLHTAGKKFILPDCGSISRTDDNELNGLTSIVIRPDYLLVFPRFGWATNLVEQIRPQSYPHIICSEVDDDYVEQYNQQSIESSYEFYVQSNS